MSVSIEVSELFEMEAEEQDSELLISNTPPDLLEKVKKMDTVPEKSRKTYEKAYDNYCLWKKQNNVQKSSPNIIKAYILHMQDKYKPSSMWTKLSMLKSMLLRHENINLENFPEIKIYMKKISKNHIPKKAYVFSHDDYTKFLLEAPDNEYLIHKVCLILGWYGFMRGGEMYELLMKRVKLQPDGDYLIKYGNTKTDPGNVENMCFVVTNEPDSPVNPVVFIKKYLDLMATRDPPNPYVFSQLRQGKVHNQRLGKHFFLNKAPKSIAMFLGKNTPEKYTGHSFRRSGATNAAENGAGHEDLKRLGRWKSSSVAEGYVQESIASKKRLATYVSGNVQKKQKIETFKAKKLKKQHQNASEQPPVQITGNRIVVNNYFQK